MRCSVTAEICVAIVDDRLLFEVITVIFMKIKPDVFEILELFRDIKKKISRYLEKKSGMSGNIFRRF